MLTGSGLARAMHPHLPGRPQLDQRRFRRFRDRRDELADELIRMLKRCTVRVTLQSRGTPANIPLSGGPYTGTGTVTAMGQVEGFDGQQVADRLYRTWRIRDLRPERERDKVRGILRALGRAFQAEIEQTRITGQTIDRGFAPHGITRIQNGTGTGTGTLVAMEPSRLADAIQRAITGSGEGVNYTQGNSEETVQGLARGFCAYVESQAEVTLTTQLNVVTTIVGTLAQGTGVEDAGRIS